MNAEASAIFQSWPGFEGTGGDDWDTTDSSVAQPGTVGFKGGPVCTRFEGGKQFVLPGCRGPGDKGYDPRVDGTTTNLVHPFTKQQFKSEMAALSWNALMGFVGFLGGAQDRHHDLRRLQRPARGRLLLPQRCSSATTCSRCSRSPASGATTSSPAATAPSGAATSCGRAAATSCCATRSTTCSASRRTSRRTSRSRTGASSSPGRTTSSKATTTPTSATSQSTATT